uniref:L-aminoadipate-semialdehyde dehydrogenase large subunit n=1 Tax=Talaromyces marneffei PM1 TaxID=1077442 RepID=A0A093UQN7_TALMA
MTALPDPTVDLDWSGYVGSVQDIFAQNVKSHPDRTCVVETASAEGPERRFTYKQIYEASNTLAHYLHDAGITNDDVVMIFAHRSVDLVVAIMGTLSSAATFTVLDPAYPPARQKIYLEVAQPRALINIGRATDEAGVLAPIVRSYIDDELNLKAEVPSLRLGDDGTLSGGEIDGKDVFYEARQKASAPPPTQVGPDSNPTLSFTSGSEGRPKGVLGRHYSLCRYFAWMAERFGLSSESKFTMLSGIAHDPIQRDVFTPLFLGAQLLVPSRSDIAHERLAEWMAKYSPTVTHLTPAMGQILVGGASATFPSLKSAFFVGDVLTTRDCKALRALAENVNIINMYGTTETQRAVSYYCIKSRAEDPNGMDHLKDTVPAGTGMQNVQLLVVNREDRNKLCSVGETGEIYVRAAGLAEGYRGDQALNDLKFVQNCNLSQNPMIRDCKTLVRRDRNEEPTLVSYIVPEMKLWPQWLESHGLEDIPDEGTDFGVTKVYLKKFRAMQTEVRDHVKGRLPSYAVPSLFIFLKALPLNPNGKVDKPNLPFPDISEQTEVASAEDIKRWESLTDTERTVATKWATLVRGLNEKKVSPDDDFFTLGGHSLLAQQMLLDIRKETGAQVSINTLYEHSTLRAFSAQIDRQLRGGETQEESQEDPAYAKSLDHLLTTLPEKFQTADPSTVRASANPTVLITGATGFLGGFIIKDLLERNTRQFRIIAHVRAKDAESGMARLERSLKGYGLWKDEWKSRISCVAGDLSKPQLGLSDEEWQRLAQEVSVVIANGATVHWVKRYQEMMAANVLSTIEAMKLCNIGKPKIFTFVSSTSVLDTEHYVTLSEKQIGTGEGAISEEDDMQWVSEHLVREAGCSQTGTCNTDDFLIRFLKGSIQLHSRPRIVNTVNSVPVNHVARVVVAAALNPLEGVKVVHVTGHPRLRMNEYLSILEYYGYDVPEISYEDWKHDLEKYVSAGGQEKDQEQHALMPLFHFCVNDLPGNTKAPELDDRNAVKILKLDADHWTGVDESAGYGISREDVGRYLRYLCETGFISWPTGRGRPLPDIRLTADQLQVVGAVGGRGGGVSQ